MILFLSFFCFCFSFCFCSDYYIGQSRETIDFVEQFKGHMDKNDIRCFISRAYSEEDPFILDEQKKIDSCLRYVGIKTILDVNAENGGLCVGGDIMTFMEDNIKNSQFVISFFTPTFLQRSKISGSGVARELVFIPILAMGEIHESVHPDFRAYLCINAIRNDRFDTDFCIIEILKVLENRIFPNRRILGIPDISREKQVLTQSITWKGLVQMMRKVSDEKSPTVLDHFLTFLKSWSLLNLEEKEKFILNFADSISFNIKEWTLQKSFTIDYDLEEDILSNFKAFEDIRMISEEQRKKATSSFKKDKILNIKIKKMGNCDTASGKYEIKWEMMVPETSSPGYCSSLFFCYAFLIKPKSFDSPSINEIIQKSQ